MIMHGYGNYFFSFILANYILVQAFFDLAGAGHLAIFEECFRMRAAFLLLYNRVEHFYAAFTYFCTAHALDKRSHAIRGASTEKTARSFAGIWLAGIQGATPLNQRGVAVRVTRAF
jgi:hypothetical protein